VTWAPLDAPLIEIGGITVETPWMTTLAPSTTILSYVMNNYWHTNYKASQSGPTQFRYALCPHGIFNQGDAQRFGVEQSQPLIVVPTAKETPAPTPYLRVTPETVMVTALKRSEDGKTVIIRLFGASGRPENATIEWPGSAKPRLYTSDLTEHEGGPIEGSVAVRAYGVVTLRADVR
jgi:alpha-mannosidase